MGPVAQGQTLFVDYYVQKKSSLVNELQIDAENFAGNYYVEATTLFRRQSDGVDMPAELTLPNVKIQSNFTFTMSSTGDPSTFTFTMDAFPGYTYFNPTKKVLCVMQIVEDSASQMKEVVTVFPDKKAEDIAEGAYDSVIVKASVPMQNATILAKPVSDMVAMGASVNANGIVTASLKPVTGFTAFNGVNTEEQSGYYMPFNIDVAGPTPDVMTFSKIAEADGQYEDTKVNIAFDPELLLRIADTDKKQKIYDFKVTLGYYKNPIKPEDGVVNKGVLELHFNKVKFE